MNRRAARWLAPILIVIASALVVGTSAGGAAAASAVGAVGAASTVTTTPEPPPITANDFLPEDRDLSDCVGVLEKPGCGSEERGGPMLTLVFALVIGGMSFVFWRVIVGVRKNRAELDRSELDRSERDRADRDAADRDPAEPVEP